METKMCRKCEMLKNVNDFYTKRAICKNCLNLKTKIYRQENQEYIKKYRQENQEYIKKYQKKYYQENKEKTKEYAIKKSKENVILLKPTYIKKNLKDKGFYKEDIESNPMLIELQRAILINKRLTKNNKNE